jgi:hypothetical protein
MRPTINVYYRMVKEGLKSKEIKEALLKARAES